MGNAPPISDSRLSLVVIRVTSSGVERRVLELPDQDDRSGYNPNASPGVNGNIYASYPNAGYVRWAVDHFERITLDERKQFPRGQMISLPDFENDANGWSRHTLFSEPLGVPLDIDVGNQFKIRVNNVKTTDGASLLIDLLHPEGAVERLFDFESHSLREVGAFEYRPAFKREVRK